MELIQKFLKAIGVKVEEHDPVADFHKKIEAQKNCEHKWIERSVESYPGDVYTEERQCVECKMKQWRYTDPPPGEWLDGEAHHREKSDIERIFDF